MPLQKTFPRKKRQILAGIKMFREPVKPTLEYNLMQEFFYQLDTFSAPLSRIRCWYFSSHMM